ncbi:MAG: hypothetical protein LBG58_05450 [Planctomycetaceae bacterium]|nr:hypothetical protein [Planctomycetaceae bacterium]
MSSRWFPFAVSIIAGCIGIILFLIIFTKDKPQTISVKLQCAHWSIFRTAQLLGIPTEPDEIRRLLPNHPKGHTLAQVVETLAKIGIDAEGYRDDWDTLSTQNCPRIVYL